MGSTPVAVARLLRKVAHGGGAPAANQPQRPGRSKHPLQAHREQHKLGDLLRLQAAGGRLAGCNKGCATRRRQVAAAVSKVPSLEACTYTQPGPAGLGGIAIAPRSLSGSRQARCFLPPSRVQRADPAGTHR